jgi:hypothetical protein
MQPTTCEFSDNLATERSRQVGESLVDPRCGLLRVGVGVLGVVTVDDGVAAAGIRVYKARVPFVGKAQ